MTKITTTSAAPDLTALREDYTPSIDINEAKQNYDYDLKKFLKYSSVTKISSDPVALEAVLTHAYHALENGLTMEGPRPGFGINAIILSMAAISSTGFWSGVLIVASIQRFISFIRIMIRL